MAGADLVFNCAAYNAVDAAESAAGRDAAWLVNADGPGLLARVCEAGGARLVHFSTNYVFSGAGARPWTEEDEPAPLGEYARSKREGELRVLAAQPSALVIRTAGVFGRAGVGSAVKGGSFPERMAERAASGQVLRVVDDQSLNPTYAGHLAAAALALARSQAAGVVHLVAEGCCSYWEFAVEALRQAGIEAVVERVSSDEFAAAAPRPLNGCLQSLVHPPLPAWQAGLAEWAASRR